MPFRSASVGIMPMCASRRGFKVYIHVLLYPYGIAMKIHDDSKKYRQLRAGRALSLFKYVPLRTRRALYSDRIHLVLSGTSLNIGSALLALN